MHRLAPTNGFAVFVRSRESNAPIARIVASFKLPTKQSAGICQAGNPSGRDFIMGVYAMLLDESCCFLAVDLDGEDWQKDATAFFGNMPTL